MLALPCALLSAVLLSQATAMPMIETQPQAVTYLSQFGYLSSRQGIAGNQIAVTNAFKDFQAFNQIRLTGELDDQTKALMSLPRCGVKDKPGSSIHARRRRYTFLGNKWRNKALTYRIISYPRNFARVEVHLEIFRAFDVWSRQTDFTFTPKLYGQADINIDFVSGAHAGDIDSFDGPGGILGHFVTSKGFVHFDNSEHWTISSYDGINLFQVAAHEFGHSLGLGHSNVQDALMAPLYREYNPSFNLHADDIEGIQRLYGRPEKIKSKRRCTGTWVDGHHGITVCSTE